MTRFRQIQDWDSRDDQDHEGFFIDPDECLFFGCCQSEASGNFAWRDADPDDKVSTVSMQPGFAQELGGVIRAAANCMVDSIYYGGKDANVIEAMRRAGVHEDCIANAGVS